MESVINTIQHYQIVEKPEIKLLGIATRTTNADLLLNPAIEQLWDKFFNQNIASQIPNRVSDDCFGAYTEYASDEKGEYTAFVGYEVENLDNVPEQLVAVTIPASKYAIFNLEGKIPDIVVQGWNAIHQLPLQRAFTGDFELYSANTPNPENAQVDIYIAIQ